MSDPRRLTAVLFTDMVGYTSLTAHDAPRARTLVEGSRALIGKHVAYYGGECLEATGDGTLSIFASAVKAAKCALAIQESVASRKDLQLRISLHLGEVERDEGHIYGDGVNVASRILSCAKPGTVVLTDVFRSALRGHGPFGLRNLGRKRFKNIDQPIRVFELHDTLGASDTSGNQSRNSRIRITQRVLIVIAVASLGLGWLWVWSSSENASQPPQLPAPTVAVLPFSNMSPDSGDVYFSNGMSDEIISLLAGEESIRVISRTSSFAFRDQQLALTEIGNRLGAKYIVEGSVRRAEDRVRIRIQLIDVSTDTYIWSQDYERNYSEIFKLQENIANAVVEHIRATLAHAQYEGRIQSAVSTQNMEAYDLYLRGRNIWLDRGRARLEDAVGFLEQAIQLEPDFARAHATLGMVYALLPEHAGREVDASQELAARHAGIALSIDPRIAEAHAALAHVYSHSLDWSQARLALEQALNLDPSNADIHRWFGIHKLQFGYVEEASIHLKKAHSLDPLSILTNAWLAEVHMIGGGDIDRSLQLLTNMVDSDYSFGHIWLALHYLYTGDIQSASEAISRVSDEQEPLKERISLLIASLRNPSEKPRLMELLQNQKVGQAGGLLYQIYTLLDEPALALEALETTMAQDPSNAVDIWAPFSVKVRQHPDFVSFARRTGMMAYWREYGWPEACRPAGPNDFDCS